MRFSFLLVVCVMCIVCTIAIAQVAPKNAQPQTVPPSAQTKPVQQAALPAKTDAKPSGSPNAAASGAEDFVIGPEDVLEIKVWHEPDLTTRSVVRPDGKIGVTLLGDVQASGLTAAQLKDAKSRPSWTGFTSSPKCL